LRPNWSKLVTERVDDSTIYSIIPLIAEGVDRKKNIPVIYSDHEEFIMFKNNVNIYRGVFRYQQDDRGLVFDREFLSNGELSLTSFVDGKSSIYRYIDGKGENVKPSLIRASQFRPTKGSNYSFNSA